MPIFPRYTGPALAEQVWTVNNLTLAWRRVRSNIQVAQRGRSAGIDAVTLRDFEREWTRQMAQLADELRTGTYRPLPARRVAIPKRSGGERAIMILAIRDRIAQRAVHQVLEPVFDPCFLDCSYGCRPGVGVPDAITRVVRHVDRGWTWVVDADVATYFDAIDQRILLGLVRQRVDDRALLQLIAQWFVADAIADPPLEDARSGMLLHRGAEAVRQFFADDGDPAPHAAAVESGAYGTAWDQAALERWGMVGPAPVQRSRVEERMWTALSMAQPVLAGAKRMVPYARRVGGRNLALAGAVAAGAVAAHEFIQQRATARRRGTPQGGALSPLLANIYLHPFDLALTRQGLRLVRFMDDFVIVCADEAEARDALAIAEQQLRKLRLTLNADKTRVVPYADGLDFLGHSLAPRQGSGRFAQGLTSFEDAEHALRAAMRHMRPRKK